MLLKNVLMSAAAASLAVAPAAVSAAPAVDRISQPSAETSELGGPGLIIAIIAGVAIIAGIIIAADDDDDEPLSP
ncbi:hypothetical protein P8Q88_03730 [Qipengyuania sp. XHP0207]|uniref:hypothetical protein n=1 Tax=Qipengyuania sp. XHP0207 TaxID=3038078 RepID=UPI00241EB811|nr:hypothetical protein [Qipengyuania sp. XHP0207]MDG5747281.1 hypothetical protein [Qipengyuania sp. XHP0207]